MKWILVIMMLNGGGVSYVPMDTQDACLRAKAQVEGNTYPPVIKAECITQN